MAVLNDEQPPFPTGSKGYLQEVTTAIQNQNGNQTLSQNSVPKEDAQNHFYFHISTSEKKDSNCTKESKHSRSTFLNSISCRQGTSDICVNEKKHFHHFHQITSVSISSTNNEGSVSSSLILADNLQSSVMVRESFDNVVTGTCNKVINVHPAVHKQLDNHVASSLTSANSTGTLSSKFIDQKHTHIPTSICPHSGLPHTINRKWQENSEHSISVNLGLRPSPQVIPLMSVSIYSTSTEVLKTCRLV